MGPGEKTQARNIVQQTLPIRLRNALSSLKKKRAVEKQRESSIKSEKISHLISS